MLLLPHALPPPLEPQRRLAREPPEQARRLGAVPPVRIGGTRRPPPRPRRDLRLAPHADEPRRLGRPPRRLEPIERRQLGVEIDRRARELVVEEAEARRVLGVHARDLLVERARTAAPRGGARPPPPAVARGCPTGPRRRRRAERGPTRSRLCPGARTCPASPRRTRRRCTCSAPRRARRPAWLTSEKSSGSSASKAPSSFSRTLVSVDDASTASDARLPRMSSVVCWIATASLCSSSHTRDLRRARAGTPTCTGSSPNDVSTTCASWRPRPLVVGAAASADARDGRTG